MDILTRYQLILDLSRKQCYDGASNMLERNSGVAKLIFDLQAKAHFMYCHGHFLSLSVKDITKALNLLKNTLGFFAETVILIKYSHKQETMLGNIKEQIECRDEKAVKVNNIAKLSEKRWTVRAVCFSRILDNYATLWNQWQHALHNDNLQTDVKRSSTRNGNL